MPSQTSLDVPAPRPVDTSSPAEFYGLFDAREKANETEDHKVITAAPVPGYNLPTTSRSHRFENVSWRRRGS